MRTQDPDVFAQASLEKANMQERITPKRQAFFNVLPEFLLSSETGRTLEYAKKYGCRLVTCLDDNLRAFSAVPIPADVKNRTIADILHDEHLQRMKYMTELTGNPAFEQPAINPIILDRRIRNNDMRLLDAVYHGLNVFRANQAYDIFAMLPGGLADVNVDFVPQLSSGLHSIGS